MTVGDGEETSQNLALPYWSVHRRLLVSPGISYKVKVRAVSGQDQTLAEGFADFKSGKKLFNSS